MAKEKQYIGTKIVSAISMDQHTFLEIEKGAEKTDLPKVNKKGYRVTYPDGYVSWSPAKAFESAYRVITKPETGILI